ncbi:Imm63 family immunity protein [Kitasatospora phosalacinea]|uniref:Imm63 family immunity protein n=1 Tax=Kitasatospora phosalacinea TaxID=2065 RepID=UPI003652C01E
MTITLEDVRAAVGRMAARLAAAGAGGHELVAFDFREGAHPFVEVRDGALHWVVVDRGRELQRRTTTDLDELLYWIAVDATGPAARRWERQRRDRFPAGRDVRIGRLAKQLDLLRGLDAGWAARFRAGVPAECPGVTPADVDAHPLD